MERVVLHQAIFTLRQYIWCPYDPKGFRVSWSTPVVLLAWEANIIYLHQITIQSSSTLYNNFILSIKIALIPDHWQFYIDLIITLIFLPFLHHFQYAAFRLETKTQQKRILSKNKQTKETKKYYRVRYFVTIPALQILHNQKKIVYHWSYEVSVK